MPQTDDAGFSSADITEDAWKDGILNDSDECTFLGSFPNPTMTYSEDFKVCKSERLSIKNGAPLHQNKKRKRRKKLRKSGSKRSTTNGTGKTKTDKTSVLDHASSDSEGGVISNQQESTRSVSPSKSRKRKNLYLEKSLIKDTYLENGGSNQKTEVFHYYQTNENRGRISLNSNTSLIDSNSLLNLDNKDHSLQNSKKVLKVNLGEKIKMDEKPDKMDITGDSTTLDSSMDEISKIMENDAQSHPDNETANSVTKNTLKKRTLRKETLTPSSRPLRSNKVNLGGKIKMDDKLDKMEFTGEDSSTLDSSMDEISKIMGNDTQSDSDNETTNSVTKIAPKKKALSKETLTSSSRPIRRSLGGTIKMNGKLDKMEIAAGDSNILDSSMDKISKIMENDTQSDSDNETANSVTKNTPKKKEPNKETLTPSSRPIRRSRKKLSRLIVAERSNTPDGIWMSISRSPSPVSAEITEPAESSNGVIVWAKLAKYPWWPAIIMDGKDCDREPATEGTQWIFWLGDHKISKLPMNQMVEFVTNFKSKVNERGSKQYFRSVNEALTICANRSGFQISSDDPSALIQWGKEGFKNSNKKEFPFIPDPLSPIPDFIRRRQEKIRSNSISDRPQCGNTSVIITSGRDRAPSAISKVKSGDMTVTDICIACDNIDAVVVGMHPLFYGGVCKECKEELKETIYAIGEDGTSSYCAVCGSSGELIICDKPGCSKVYCSSCIKLFAAEGQLDEVLMASPWYCYFCLQYDPKVHGYLRKTDNWETNVIQLFHTEPHVNIFPELSYNDKRPIRVLSLFDGIGTGKLVLDRLNIEVEVYYASEIDQDSLLVSNVRHNILSLGDVQSLSDNDIAELCPFDLLIGGSPCNDLSLVNPIRKGLYDPTGTGKLFFDFFRILRAIQLNNKNKHLFWLYENVASMPHEYRGIISRFLQCEPSVIDSKHFSPQNRARYYWGNIPGLYSSIPSHYLERDIPLQSILTPGCSRNAVVDKVRCITTRSNSLVQKGGAYPIEMNGRPDCLWINELEKAFGFPEHHTDIGNLSFNRRQHLLGRAWTVPVIEYILKPLRNFFKLTDDPVLPPGTPSKSIQKQECDSPTSTSLSSP